MRNRLLFVFCLFAGTNIFSPAVYAADDKLAEAIHRADLAVTTRRVQAQRFATDLEMLFPESGTAQCYQSALSNYIENRWEKIAHQTGCDSKQVDCRPLPHPHDPVDESMNKEPTSQEEIILVNTWVIAAKLYHEVRGLIEHMTGKPLPKAKPVHFSAEEITAWNAELNTYLTGCTSYKPVRWSVVGTPLDPHQHVSIAIKLGIYNLLANHVAVYKLPPDKALYVNCLYTFTQIDKKHSDTCQGDKKCIESPPADTKEDLLKILTELTARGCTPENIHAVTHGK